MSVSKMFERFVLNLAIDNGDQISLRYGEITCCLNKKYRKTESKTANSLKVGSFGRYTAIKGISDLDMLYIMPASEWDRFKDGRQSALLQEVKGVIKDRYPNTDMRGDGQVVVVSFTNQDFEVVPVFELTDGSFKYPDTHNGGSSGRSQSHARKCGKYPLKMWRKTRTCADCARWFVHGKTNTVL